MRVLVCGGAGYVGSHCIRALRAAGHELTILDNLSRGHRQAIGDLPLVQADLADTDMITEVLDQTGSEAVMHFAASIEVGESVVDPLSYYANNVSNTVSLLQAMQRARVTRLVFSSTAAVYGQPEYVPIDEQHPKQPVNPYGRSKWMMEQVFADCTNAWGLGFTALRYFNAAGAAGDGTIGEDHTPESHLIPLILQVPLDKRDHIKLFGTDWPTSDGTCVRDYIHVEDLAEAHRVALEALETGVQKQYNIGTGRGTTVRQVVEAARRITGHAIPAQEAPRRAGDPAELVADVNCIASELGWRATRCDLDQIVASAWQWHRTHPDGFETR